MSAFGRLEMHELEDQDDIDEDEEVSVEEPRDIQLLSPMNGSDINDSADNRNENEANH